MRRGILSLLVVIGFLTVVGSAGASDELQAAEDCLKKKDIDCLFLGARAILEDMDPLELENFGRMHRVSAAAHLSYLQGELGGEASARESWKFVSGLYDEWVVLSRSEGRRGDSQLAIVLSQRLDDSGKNIAAQNLLTDGLYEGGTGGPRKSHNGETFGWHRGRMVRQLGRLGGAEPIKSYYQVARRYALSLPCQLSRCQNYLEMLEISRAFSDLGEDVLMKDAMWIEQKNDSTMNFFVFPYYSWPIDRTKAKGRDFFVGKPTAEDLKILIALSLCLYLERCDAGREVYDELMIGFERPWTSNARYLPYMTAIEHFTDLVVHADGPDYFVSNAVTPASESKEQCMEARSVACLVEQIISTSVSKNECAAGYRGLAPGLAEIAVHVGRAGEKDLARALLVEGVERWTNPKIEGEQLDRGINCTDEGPRESWGGPVHPLFLSAAMDIGEQALLQEWIAVNLGFRLDGVEESNLIGERVSSLYGNHDLYKLVGSIQMLEAAGAHDLASVRMLDLRSFYDRVPPEAESAKYHVERELAKYMLLYSDGDGLSYFLSAARRIGALEMDSRSLADLLDLYRGYSAQLTEDQRVEFHGQMIGKLKEIEAGEFSALAILLIRLDEELANGAKEVEYDLVEERYWKPTKLIHCAECWHD